MGQDTGQAVSGADLRLLRLAHRITQTDLAVELQVARDTVRRTEAARRPRVTTVERYRRAILRLAAGAEPLE
jgi:transcriptional regulator with XRE-family HTH domain